MLMPAVTASPILTQGPAGNPGSTAAAVVAIMQNGTPPAGPVGSGTVTVVPSAPTIQQVSSVIYNTLCKEESSTSQPELVHLYLFAEL